MIEVTERDNSFLSDFEESMQRAEPQGWLRDLRRKAFDRFTDLGFPTTRHEDWLFTNVAPIARTSFRAGLPEQDMKAAERIAEHILLDVDCIQLVFLNGHFAEELSDCGRLPAGVRAGSLAAELRSDGSLLQRHLGRYADFEQQAFASLNTAFIQDGAFVYLPDGADPGIPIHLLFLSSSGGSPTVSHPRNLILAGEGCRATIIESYAGAAGDRYFTNAVTEVAAGDNSVIRHCKLQRESEDAFHVATVRVHQGRGSRCASHSISLGARLARNDIHSVLAGEGAECEMNGLYLAQGEQHVDNHTTIDHASPHCDSRELYKGILDGRSGAVFNGRIIVRPDAQRTNSRQTNKNLLLSKEATVNTKPQLEISADDVKCAHGATIGQLDENALFYMQSRGIAPGEARHILIYAFGSEIINRMDLKPIQCQLDLILLSRLSAGRKIKETP